MRLIQYFFILTLLFKTSLVIAQSGSWEALKNEARHLGKEQWRPMLIYAAELHEKSTHGAAYPFDYDWEEIGPGYGYGPAFGHWDIVHQVIDVMPAYPMHAYHQLLNNIKNQESHGLLPGSIWLPDGETAPGNNPTRDKAEWDKKDEGHPPVWVFAVQDYAEFIDSDEILKIFYTPLVRQITWFENERSAESEGFFYNDILLKKWESGVDQGIRFDGTGMGAWACIDATSHVYMLYQTAAHWANDIGLNHDYFDQRAEQLKQFIQNELYSVEDGMFYDIWAIKDFSLRHASIENMWPIVVGAAAQEQADRFIDDYLLNPEVFFAEHPVTSVGVRDAKFELRMWRGPAWNSMSYWAARGCINYGRYDAAMKILEKALDKTAENYAETGTIWEFYHPFGGSQDELQRKPQSEYNKPFKDYLGHNPVIAMARLYEAAKKRIPPGHE